MHRAETLRVTVVQIYTFRYRNSFLYSVTKPIPALEEEIRSIFSCFWIINYSRFTKISIHILAMRTLLPIFEEVRCQSGLHIIIQLFHFRKKQTQIAIYHNLSKHLLCSASFFWNNISWVCLLVKWKDTVSPFKILTFLIREEETTG